MDLNSLPEEMLASVLKYTKYRKVRLLRKMNERIDRVALRNRISTKISVETLRIGAALIKITLGNAEASQYEMRKEELLAHNDKKNHMEVLAKNLPNIKIDHTLSIDRDIPFDDKFFTLLHNHRNNLRLLTTVELRSMTFELSREMAKQLFQEVLPNATFLTISECYNNWNIVNSEVLGNRQWDNLSVLGTFYSNHGCDDSFLLEIGTNCKWLSLRLPYPLITVNGIYQMLKKYLAGPPRSSKIHLDLVSFVDLNNTEIEPMFEELVTGIKIISTAVSAQPHHRDYNNLDRSLRFNSQYRREWYMLTFPFNGDKSLMTELDFTIIYQ